MIGLLKDILCVLRNLVLGVLWAFVELVNLVILALGAFIALVVDLLPAMPAAPTIDQPEALGWLAWGLPVAGIVAGFGALLALYLGFLLIRIALRWAKAV